MLVNASQVQTTSRGDACDVFLSYHSLDAAAVRAIADYLQRQGLKPFLDRWYLTPGQITVSPMTLISTPASVSH